MRDVLSNLNNYAWAAWPAN